MRPAHRVEVPEAVRIADTSAAPDYAAAFEVEVGDAGEGTPEQWARLIFEGAPTALRWFVLIGWRIVLRLRLGPAQTPGYVLGWRILDTTPDAITLEAHSKLITADKIVQVQGSRVTVATLVRYERRSGRLIWTAISPIHHRIEPLLLNRAASQRRT